MDFNKDNIEQFDDWISNRPKCIERVIVNPDVS